MSNNFLLTLNQAVTLTKKDIVIITADEPRLFPSIQNSIVRKILKFLALIVSHIRMGIKIKENKHRDAQIVYGFSTEVWLFAWIASFFWTKNVYLQNHHNLQQACTNPLMRFLLKLYAALNYRYIINETTSALKELGYNEEQISKHISYPITVEPETARNLFSTEENHQKKVGIVGQIRQGKKVEETVNSLLKIQEKLEFLLILGADDFSALEGINLEKAKLVNTTSREDYMAVIASCDVIILNYEQAKYYYRCSGVIGDAVSVRTYVICPNYPLMNHQLSYPSPVGLMYNHESELEAVLKKVFELPPAKENPAFEEHFQARSIAKIAEFLDQVV